MQLFRLLPGVLLLATHLTPEAHAWGPIGHRMVAETAALLMEKTDPTRNSTESYWGGFLSRHRFEMGYYAFVPDASFRHKGAALEPPTHFFDIDTAIGRKPLPSDLETIAGEIPKKYSDMLEKIAQRESASTTARKLSTDVGSAPWRIEQLQRLASDELKPLRKVQGSWQSGKKDPEGAGRVYRALLYLGLLAHYTGDATMPYHAIEDFNGWETGQGGVHFYFEADCVNTMEPGLSSEVLQAATANRKKWLEEWKVASRSTFEVMLRIFVDSALRSSEVAKIDLASALIKRSDLEKKIPAVRKNPSEGCPAFRPLIIERLAKAAVLTAHIWGTALNRSVDFTSAADLHFSDMESDPAYIKPDYR